MSQFAAIKMWVLQLLLVLMHAALAVQTAPAQSATATQILGRALDAHGGREVIAALSAVRFRDSAEGATHDQSPTPEPPFITTTVSDLITVDPHGERVQRQERRRTYEQTFRIDGHERPST